jgi:hypothetical protein
VEIVENKFSIKRSLIEGAIVRLEYTAHCQLYLGRDEVTAIEACKWTLLTQVQHVLYPKVIKNWPEIGNNPDEIFAGNPWIEDEAKRAVESAKKTWTTVGKP